MKKLLLLCCCLWLTAAPLLAADSYKTPQTAPTNVVSRNPQDSTQLTLLGKKYWLLASTPTQYENYGWINIYTLNRAKSNENFISITKISNAEIERIIEQDKTDMKEFMTFDTRNPQDVLASWMENGTYIVNRLVQVQNDVFMLSVSISEYDDEEIPHIFQAVRNTPIQTFTENFVETSCRFGSDCRMN